MEIEDIDNEGTEADPMVGNEELLFADQPGEELVAALGEGMSEDEDEEVSSESNSTECPASPDMGAQETSDPDRRRSHSQMHNLVETMRTEAEAFGKGTDTLMFGGGGGEAYPPDNCHTNIKQTWEEEAFNTSSSPTMVRPKVGGGKPSAFEMQRMMYGSKGLEPASPPWFWSNQETTEAEDNSGRNAKVSCDICQKMVNGRGLSRHKRTHSENRPYFACPLLCGRKFVSPQNVERHLKSTLHMDDREQQSSLSVVSYVDSSSSLFQ